MHGFWPKLVKIANFEVFTRFLSPNMTSITKNDKTIIMLQDQYFDVLGKSREKMFLHHFVCLPPGDHVLRM